MLPATLLSNVLSMKPNIQIDPVIHPCLTDFRLKTIDSGLKNFTGSSPASIGGTAQWMSPEFFYPERFDSDHGYPTGEPDHGAFRMVTFEALGGFTPFAPWEDHTVIWRFIHGERLKRPEAVKGMSIEAVCERLEQISSTWRLLPTTTERGCRERGNRSPSERSPDPPSEIGPQRPLPAGSWRVREEIPKAETEQKGMESHGIYSDAGQIESGSGPDSLDRRGNLPPCILSSRKQEPQE